MKEENGVKKQILKYLAKTNDHPTARELFTEIESKAGKINRKIYLRELKKLTKEKRILSILSINNQNHYDIRTYHHYHFMCEICGNVRDILLGRQAVEMLISYAQSFINSFGKITKVNMSFMGICHECKTKMRKK